MENNKLSVANNSIVSIDNQISIGNKILLRKDKKQEVIDFLINFTYEEVDEIFALVFISNQYPLSYEMIEKYQDYLDFEHLSWNSNLNWFDGLIDLYLESWNWKNLSSNTSLPWSIEFINKYEDYWDWEKLCANEKLPWNKEFIIKYMDKFLEKYNSWGISSNKGLIYTEEIIPLFVKKPHVYEEGQTSSDYVKKDSMLPRNKVCLGIFNKNGEKIKPQNVYYKMEYKYHIKTVYDDYVFNNLDNDEICWSCICQQIKKVDKDFLINNNYRIDWYALSENEYCLNEEIIELFKDELIWSTLSSNKNLPWSIEFIDKYNDLWNWKYLSRNNGIPWTEDLIDAFIDKWNWKSSISLSSNPNLPISVDFINKYKNYIDFDELQRNNEGDFWTKDFIDAFENELDTMWLTSNKSFPWSINMIKKYKYYYFDEFIHQKVIDEILPYLDDEIVTHIFDKIISSYE